MRVRLALLLIVSILADNDCIDVDLGDACVEYCSTVNVECIEQCSGNHNCIDYCNSNETKCINSCPCHGECIDGCDECDSSFCQCVDPELNADFIKCEQYVTSVYVECASKCGSDLACNSGCARQFDEDMKQCPCQEKCPGGCPCPGYDCEVTTTTESTSTSGTTTTPTTATTTTTTQPVPLPNSVLVVYYDFKALVTNVAGEVTELDDWSNEGEARSDSQCSLTFQNEMLIYGQVLTDEHFLITCLNKNVKTESKINL